MMELKVTVEILGLDQLIKALSAISAKPQVEIKKESLPIESDFQNVPVETNDPVLATPVQTSTLTYSMDDLAKAAVQLVDAGRMNELQQLLGRYGVQALPQLPPEQYGAFATDLRGLGAQI